MSEVVRQISERLAAKGHEVTVATGTHPDRAQVATIEGVQVCSFDVGGKSALGLRGKVGDYRKFLLESEADLIVNFAAQQWATDLALPLLPKLRAKTVFVPTGFSALADPLFRSYFEKMKRWMAEYDACVFLSDDYRDVNFARAAGIEKIAIIPNGAAEEEFDRQPAPRFRKRWEIPPDGLLIIHVAGYLSISKGQKEAIQIFSQSQIENATLLVVSSDFAKPTIEMFGPRKLARGFYQMLRGRGLSGFAFPLQIQAARRVAGKVNASANRKVLFAALSREETVDAFLEADIMLFPSWIECSPLVLFEAAAARTPFLVTDVGNAREITKWMGGGEILPGRSLLDRDGSVCADVTASVPLLERLCRSESARTVMGETLHSAWRRSFTWAAIANQYEALYSKLLRGEDIRGQFSGPTPFLS